LSSNNFSNSFTTPITTFEDTPDQQKTIAPTCFQILSQAEPVEEACVEHVKETISHVATLLWPSVGVKPNTLKVEDLESSGTPECLEFNSKAQNTLH
jgi:hypothetical protein